MAICNQSMNTMGSEGEKPTQNLPLFTLPVLMKNLKHSGNLCSPLHTNASVPFRWEEQPGKPRLALPPSNTNIIPKCLELPPRLLFSDPRLITKTLSPTTVLEGPYNSVGRSMSFSFLRKGQVSSHDGALSSTKKDKGSLFGSWRRKSGARPSTSAVHGGDFVFSSVSDDGGTGSFNGEGEAAMPVATVGGGKRDISSLSQAKSHFWATMYGTFKQAIPKRSTKCKKQPL